MPKVTLVIPQSKIQRVISAVKGLQPIPENNAGAPLFTDEQWVRQILRSFLASQVHRWETKQAVTSARNSVVRDDEIST